MNADTNTIIRKFLINQAALTALVSTRIYWPRIPQKATLPAIGFFPRGGITSPYIPDLPRPSVQFDCWGTTSIEARTVYRTLYDVLQGIQNQTVTIDVTDYKIMSAIEEVQGQDLVDETIPEYFRVVAFFQFVIRAG